MEPIHHTDLNLECMGHNKKKNSFVTTSSGSISFGIFPENNNQWPTLEIRLKLGLVGHGKGRLGAFGVRHIFEKHGQEMNLTCPSEVSGHIESVIKTGAIVMVDSKKDPNKPLIIESSTGMAILTLSKCKTYYHIISSYKRFSHPGITIATIK